MQHPPRDRRYTGLLLVCALGACENSDTASVVPPDSGFLHDGGGGSSLALDSGLFFNDGGVACCAPSPQPSCSMIYGGASIVPRACSKVSDGMPSPSDPAWRLISDAYGCPTWTSKGALGPCCGSRPPAADAGAPPVYQCYGDPVSQP